MVRVAGAAYRCWPRRCWRQANGAAAGYWLVLQGAVLALHERRGCVIV